MTHFGSQPLRAGVSPPSVQIVFELTPLRYVCGPHNSWSTTLVCVCHVTAACRASGGSAPYTCCRVAVAIIPIHRLALPDVCICVELGCMADTES